MSAALEAVAYVGRNKVLCNAGAEGTRSVCSTLLNDLRARSVDRRGPLAPPCGASRSKFDSDARASFPTPFCSPDMTSAEVARALVCVHYRTRRGVALRGRNLLEC